VKRQCVYKTALGISVGDLVRTSYDTGPYRVKSINPPHYVENWVGVLVIRTWPVVSLVCSDPVKKDGDCYLNGIRREVERWFNDQNDEIFVTPAAAGQMFQMELLSVDEQPPYAFQAGVDYRHNAWKCDRCGVDFNAEPNPDHPLWPADHCGYTTTKLLLMEPRPTPPETAWSDLQLVLGFTGSPKDWQHKRQEEIEP
jgi:hypothetical protein